MAGLAGGVGSGLECLMGLAGGRGLGCLTGRGLSHGLEGRVVGKGDSVSNDGFEVVGTKEKKKESMPKKPRQYNQYHRWSFVLLPMSP